MGDTRLEADCCGHIFQTSEQRRAHEAKVDRGERVACPCGDVCSEGVRTGTVSPTGPEGGRR